jgi:isopenicillin N synthase-like dioxygenase
VDENGNLDTAEFLNISRDDALSFPTPTHRTYPPTVQVCMSDTVAPFVKASVEVTRVLINTLGKRLGLPEDIFDKLHSIEEHSGSETRLIKNPPVGEQGITEGRVALGAHTDFGSLVKMNHCLILNQILKGLSLFSTISLADSKFSFLGLRNGSSLRSLSFLIV